MQTRSSINVACAASLHASSKSQASLKKSSLSLAPMILLALGATLLALSLSGCSSSPGMSKSEFVELDEHTRATTICRSDADLKSRFTEIEYLNKEIATKEANIKRGYVMKEFCGTVPALIGFETVCEPFANVDSYEPYHQPEIIEDQHKRQLVCRKVPIYSTTNRCEEVREYVSKGAETKLLKQAQATRDKLTETYFKLYDKCMTDLSVMSADEAYQYYRQSKAPK